MARHQVNGSSSACSASRPSHRSACALPFLGVDRRDELARAEHRRVVGHAHIVPSPDNIGYDNN
jgi:hypothetical protein